MNEPKTIICAKCNKETPKTGRRQRYCPECRYEAHLEVGREYHRLHKSEAKAKKAYANREKPELKLSIADVDKLARSEGLSYGQYSAQYGLYDNIYERSRLHI